MTSTKEFGDYQTPLALAKRVCELLKKMGAEPSVVLEPTCGTGNFLLAAIETFESLHKVIGAEINQRYLDKASDELKTIHSQIQADLIQGDFFKIDWHSISADINDPLLILGNPPWVTNSTLSQISGTNTPVKENFQKFSGFDALTGKSNFDISEWMLLRLLEVMRGKNAQIAMLCKVSVARKIINYAWSHNAQIENPKIFLFDAMSYFGVSVDACLLTFVTSDSLVPTEEICSVYSDLSLESKSSQFGIRENTLIANLGYFEETKHLYTIEEPKKWRSGIKHDCAKIIELTKRGDRFFNGQNELVEIEDTFLYPMVKGSEVANDTSRVPKKWMIVTQKTIGQETNSIKLIAPKTWDYLVAHQEYFQTRKSRIYKGKPQFSIFGVGDYSFALWKVAICGLYKKLSFKALGPFEDKPIMLDDTCYFFPCNTQEEAEEIVKLLGTPIAQRFYNALIFWNEKRPIKASILNRLDLNQLAKTPLARLESSPVGSLAAIAK